MGMNALISVADKTGIAQLATVLRECGYTILSTGGTAAHLRERGIAVQLIEHYTGSPEVLEGRVKTLHPKVHAGILARSNVASDAHDLATIGAQHIQLVVVNLYPFAKTIAQQPPLAEAIEQIDIGGVALIRAAAKNYAHVAVVTDPAMYSSIAQQLQAHGSISEQMRKALAVQAFAHTSQYDSTIEQYLAKELLDEERLHLALKGGKQLRYGENPHQKARIFLDGTCGIASATQLHGKALSYTNYLDADAAMGVVEELGDVPAVAVIKHMTPCGVATGKTLKSALEAAWSGDIVSAFGSVIAFSHPIDLESAQFLKGKFVEMLIAPGYDADALELLCKKSKDMRIMQSVPGRHQAHHYRQVGGGMLEQDHDRTIFSAWDLKTKTPFPEEKKALATFTMIACKHTKSNAIVLGYEYAPGAYKILGSGAGQPNRVDSLRKLAIPKTLENIERDYAGADAREMLGKCVLASDAFFPFDDTVREAQAAGIQYIIQPGGSIRDEEIIAACDELGVAMIFTGDRHFLH